jgi:parallel beta-helix repeat protein
MALAVFFVFASWIIPVKVQAATVYVSTAGNDANDGLSWATAKLTVQAGLNTAQAGDQVWVAAGTYVENITLNVQVELYGGFAGGETDLAQRNWLTNTTVLNGDQSGSVVITPSGATQTTRIDGFTIRNGNGTLSGSYRYGGGIYCFDSSSPTITNNTITSNSGSRYGGGIYCGSYSSPTIANNTVTGNSVNFGGGIYCGSDSFPTIANNTIMGNSALTGGGIHCSFSSPTIANNTITGNSASRFGGGIYSNSSSSPTIANNTITGNNAELGGGIYCGGSTTTIDNTIISFNSSGIYNSGGMPSLRYNCLYGNAAYNYSGLPDPTGADGNISADPRLVGAIYGNVHIQPDSPCVDAGDNSIVQPGWQDMDGETRIIGSHVDIGADESDGIWWPEDPPVVVRVGTEGNDANDGSSWATAKLTVQAGIDAASASGGEVWVKMGTYMERIALCSYVHVYGGFNGTEDQWEERDWVEHVTILDGQAAGSVVTSISPGYLISTIDGVNIRNGTATSGGGIYCGESSSPTIANNTIMGNSASSNGGGIYCNSYSFPMIANNTVTDNSASTGGSGIGCYRSSPAIANNTILGNSSGQGGGVYCDRSSPTITNNTLTGNSAVGPGGGIYCRLSSPTIANNTITGNNTSNSGGGIDCFDSSPTIAGNTITGNNASFYGGGIYCYDSSPTIASNTITGNNASINGGGIYCSSSSPTIANNTITGNSATTGGGINCSSSAPTIVNTIVAFNTSGIYRSGTETPSLRYNCVYGNTEYNYSGLPDPTGTDGNISADPGLAGVSYGNVHIQPNSPCVDAGDDNIVQPGWRDMDGETRIMGSYVDMGADESDGTWWPEDPPVVVRVGPEGDDANDGSSWATAKLTVQAGIDTASASGGEVWVKAGTYLEQITLRLYVHVYGGFDGTENQRDQRDWVAHITILDGQAAGSVVTSLVPGYQPSTIDGFTIRNGIGTLLEPYSDSFGGGIYCDDSSPTIANNTITGNSVSGGGGGIFCGGTLSPTIANNTITGNSASLSYYYSGSGGGIYCSNSPTIVNNIITGNSAKSDGGGIYCYGTTSSPTIANNTIAGNSAYLGGGILYDGSGSPAMIANNTITGNIASYGGGIYCGGSSPTIANNTITGNRVFLSGGGIYCTSSTTIVNTIVAFNSSGIYSSGGIPSLWHNCVYGNTEYNYSGLPDPTGTDGNISADPRLAGVIYGNMHIQPDSPCVDAGDDNIVQPGWQDVDGQARIMGSHVDIGADESDGTWWPEGPPVVARVSPEGDDANDGLSWATAKLTVQAGIDIASASGGEVWVKAGTYLERITLRLYVYVYGGFNGTENQRDQRDWVAHVTILDGQAAGSVVTALPGHRLSTIDGFTIRNGIGTFITVNHHPAYYGGGIYCYDSSPTIANNTITGNSASPSGGGIYCAGSSSPMIVSNTITGNSTSYGGGIYCGGSSYPTIISNTITGNSVSSSGGGIYCGGSSPTITSNTIAGNSASRGGGIYCYDSSPTIANNTITGNNAYYDGGGIYCDDSSPTIANTIVVFNSSGIYKSGTGTPSPRYNCVYGNTEYNYSGLTDPTGTDGNISADPQFVRPASPGPDGQWGTGDDDYGDLRLQALSPCIDAGNNADVPADTSDLDGDGNTTESMPFDLARRPRFMDDPDTPDCQWAPGTCGTAPIVDMGAYEFIPVIPGDFNHDGYVDSEDYTIFETCASGPAIPHNGGPACQAADFDDDNDVDQDDFGIFQRCYSGEGNPADPSCAG